MMALPFSKAFSESDYVPLGMMQPEKTGVLNFPFQNCMNLAQFVIMVFIT